MDIVGTTLTKNVKMVPYFLFKIMNATVIHVRIEVYVQTIKIPDILVTVPPVLLEITVNMVSMELSISYKYILLIVRVVTCTLSLISLRKLITIGCTL